MVAGPFMRVARPRMTRNSRGQHARARKSGGKAIVLKCHNFGVSPNHSLIPPMIHAATIKLRSSVNPVGNSSGALFLREPFPEKVYIDNSKLNGFLDPFKKIDCFHMDCDGCGYGERIASQAISIDEEWRQEMISRFGRAMEVLVKGEMAGVKK